MPVITTDFQLLGGGYCDRPIPVRPPWAIPERRFVNLCDCCGDCINACPQKILVRGRGGYPQVDFSNGGCTFCGECVASCTRGGLDDQARSPWNLKAFIAQSCDAHQGRECNACADKCSTSAIRFRSQVGSVAIPVLDQNLCTGCGQCISSCPAGAINMIGSIQEGGLLS